MASDDPKQTVGEYTTLKTAVGGAQPSRIKTEGAGDSEELASSIAKRKAEYEREPISGDSGKGGGEDDKEPGFFGRFRVPLLIISGLVLTVVGAVLAAAKQSKDAEERDL